MGQVGRGELTDEEWARIQPLLPAQKPWVGRPNKDHRPIVNGICWVLRTGAPWQDLPAAYGKWRTVASRFYRWSHAGVWQRVQEALLREADAQGRFDWEVHFVDGSVIRAHQHAAGAQGGVRRPRRSGAVRAASPPSCT